MSESDPPPNLSAAFHVGRSFDSQQSAILTLARHAEAQVRTTKAHWREITRVDSNSQANANLINALTLKVTELQTKVAIYSALGSFVGGALVAAVMHFWK